MIQATYFQLPNEIPNKNQLEMYGLNKFNNMKFKRSIKTSQQGKPYNTNLKHEIMKRNNIVIRPYD